MAGTKTDFKIYNEEFFGGYVETLQQNSEAFNAASNNSLRLIPQRIQGDYEKESFIKSISGLVGRRDVTSIADATDKKLEQGEKVGVKINRKIGPVANTMDSFRKISRDPSEMSFLLGQQTGKAVAVDYVNTTISAVRAAIAAQSTQAFSAIGASTETMTHSHLVKGMAKMGDAASRLVAWVMHSKPYFDLVGQALTDKIFEVAGVVVYQGTVATLGKPTVVIDAPALFGDEAGGVGVDYYYTLGLVADAAVAKESEERYITSQEITGKENLILRIQGEYAFNLGLQGFAWDVTNGGANPTDAALATGTNWDSIVADPKDLAGVHITTK